MKQMKKDPNHPQTGSSKHHQKNRHPYTLAEILGAPLTREQALASIRQDEEAAGIFNDIPPDAQNQLLSFIQGAQGLKITYDSFFKYVMNPGIHPARLEQFLSAILGQKVIIQAVLPLEGNRMSDTGGFVIMDILVTLIDGTTVNVEIQKIGYDFPGERASCYISDFIMRQYNRVKDERGKHFSFRDLKPVILIVIMEESTSAFKAVAPKYIHREKISFDSKAKVQTLSKTIYISLDTFHTVVHNINTKLKAWLTFLSSDRPADIVRLVNAYPEFLDCYHDIVEFRKSPKELMNMYSEALAILDKNTEIYMCEKLKKEVEELKRQVTEHKMILSERKERISETNAILLHQLAELEEKNAKLLEKNAEIVEKEAVISEKEAEISEKDAEISEKDAEIAFLKKQLEEVRANR